MHAARLDVLVIRLLITAFLLVSAILLPAAAQQVPAGVTYKLAPEPMNAAAKANLEKALAGAPAFPKELLKDTFTCGPMLWKDLKPTADKILLESKEVIGFVETPAPTKVDLRAMITPEQRVSFWNALLKSYPEIKSAKVRKANEKEILYYWATIPFDIEEPFFVIDAGANVFVAHFASLAPALFWIDRVDDLGKLKN
jgi:hypothetical protein